MSETVGIVSASEGWVITCPVLTLANWIEFFLDLAITVSDWTGSIIFLVFSEIEFHWRRLILDDFRALPKTWGFCMVEIVRNHWKTLPTNHLLKTAERSAFSINIRFMALKNIFVNVKNLLAVLAFFFFTLRSSFRVVLYFLKRRCSCMFENRGYQNSFIFNFLHVQFFCGTSEDKVNVSLTLDLLFRKTLFNIQKSPTFNNFSSTAFNFRAGFFQQGSLQELTNKLSRIDFERFWFYIEFEVISFLRHMFVNVNGDFFSDFFWLFDVNNSIITQTNATIFRYIFPFVVNNLPWRLKTCECLNSLLQVFESFFCWNFNFEWFWADQSDVNIYERSSGLLLWGLLLAG